MTDDRLPPTVKSLSEVVAWWAKRTPDSPALLGPEIDILTYGDLAEVMASVSRQLHSIGVSQQDHVALLLPEDAVGSALLLGVAGTAIAVALNPHAAVPELEALDTFWRPAGNNGRRWIRVDVPSPEL